MIFKKLQTRVEVQQFLNEGHEVIFGDVVHCGVGIFNKAEEPLASIEGLHLSLPELEEHLEGDFSEDRGVAPAASGPSDSLVGSLRRREEQCNAATQRHVEERRKTTEAFGDVHEVLEGNTCGIWLEVGLDLAEAVHQLVLYDRPPRAMTASSHKEHRDGIHIRSPPCGVR